MARLSIRNKITPNQGYFDTKQNVRDQVLSLEGQTLFGYAWNKAYQLTYLRQLGVQFKKITMIEDVLFNIEVFRTIDSCKPNCKNIISLCDS